MYAANPDSIWVPANSANEEQLLSSTRLLAGNDLRDLWPAWAAKAGDMFLDVRQFHACNVGAGAFKLTSPMHGSPQRAEWIGDDNYMLTKNVGSLSDSPSPSCYLPGSAVSLIEHLPDELLRHIFHFLPAPRDRSACASVSKRWLLIQSHLFPDEVLCMDGVDDEDGDEVQSREVSFSNRNVGLGAVRRVTRQCQWALGDLSRSLEGRKASDTRLCAVAVGTMARGGLGKLSLHQSIATDVGLSAVGYCSSALKTLCLWDCPYVENEGLALIGKGCGLLEKVDLFKCPKVGDHGLQSIARHCPLLSFLSIDECVSVTNRAIAAIGEGCRNLLSLSLRRCPSIGDPGLEFVICNAKRLRRVKLDGLKVGDRTLACIGLYAKAMVRLSLSNLNSVTEEGFLWLTCVQGMPSLQRLSVTSCKSFSDEVCAMWQLGHGLKHLSLVRCNKVSDGGLTLFMKNAASLEVLQLEMCNAITAKGLVQVISNAPGKLKEISLKNCLGLEGVNVPHPTSLNVSSVKSISIMDCPKVTDVLLALIGCLCPHATSIDFSGLSAVTDEGILAFLYSGRRQLNRVNLSSCEYITDRSVCAISEQCGAYVKTFHLNGCMRVTDKSIKSVAKHCICIEDLDVSQCSISDGGVSELIVEAGPTLNSLNLSFCRGITDQVLPLIEEHCCGLSGLNLKHCQGLSEKYLSLLESRLWHCNILSD